MTLWRVLLVLHKCGVFRNEVYRVEVNLGCGPYKNYSNPERWLCLRFFLHVFFLLLSQPHYCLLLSFFSSCQIKVDGGSVAKKGCWWWGVVVLMASLVVAVLVAGGGGPGALAAGRWGPQGLSGMTFLFYKNFLTTRHTCVRVHDLALGKDLFAGRMMPSAFFREFTLGNGFADRNCPFVDNIRLSTKTLFPVV
jgi:hypothetical protein